MPRSSARSLRAATALVLGAVAACVNPGDPDIATLDAVVADGLAPSATYMGRVEGYVFGQLSEDGASWTNMEADLDAGNYNGQIAGPAGPDAAPLLSMGPIPQVFIDLRDSSGIFLHRNSTIYAGRYRYVRLVVSPRLNQGGAVPPTIVRLTGTVGGVEYLNQPFTVTSTTLLVQREISPLALRDGSRVRFKWTLNSSQWITPEALAAKKIDTVAVKAAVTLTIEEN
jgi:hypothetical protein